MLPLIGALAGSAIAPSFGMAALTGGALGSGLGTYLQTGDLEKGILSGIGSYGLGKLGSMAMGAGDAAKATQTAQTPTAIKEGMKAGTGITMAQPPLVQPPSSMFDAQPTVVDKINAPFTTTAPANQAGVPFFDREVPKMTGLPQLGSAQTTNPDTIGSSLMSGISTGITGESLAYEPPKFEKKKSSFNTEEADAPDRRSRMPGGLYRPGIDPEFDFYAREGGLARFQEGGEVQADMSNKNDKEVLDMAIMAVKGQSPMPEIVLGEFLVRFGEEALRNLVRSVQSGEVDAAAGKAEGMVNGAGDGMEDLVPASLEGQQDVMLSEGEFVVPADVVSGIGNGSTDAGADRLYDMLDRVRQSRTGTREQAPQINAPEMMPA